MQRVKKVNTVLFRADANPSVGFGHIMRCLSIADAAKDFHQEAVFLLADTTVQALVKGRGYRTVVLGTDYKSMESETEKVGAVIEQYHAEMLLVDSYFVTERYLNTLRHMCKRADCRLVYIDDVLAFPYPCDVLVNYNIYGPDADYRGLYRGTTSPVLLLGTSFVPLRKEFQSLKSRAVRKQGKHVLVSTGGSDSEHMTLALVEEIRKNAAESVTFHMVVGAMNADRDAISVRAEKVKNIVLHENVSNMSELMQEADAAVSAAGSTLYELCAAQTPAVTYILADNQIPGAEGFARHGILKSCGDIRVLGSRELARRLVQEAVSLCGQYDERLRIAERMSGVVDGRGAGRIVKTIIKDRYDTCF